MSRVIFLFLLMWCMPAGAQVKPSVFLSPGSGAELHTRIAILPFYCIEDPADFTGNPAYQAVQDKQIGLELQHAMYTLMVGFGPNFTVKVQDFYTTNDLLRKEGLTDFRFKNMQEITRLLQVDAVLWAVVTHNPTLFREDDSLKVVMQRQCIPGDAKKKDIFLSLFNMEGECFWTLAANSELLRNLLYFENNRFQLFQWMQELPYWQGDKIKLL